MRMTSLISRVLLSALLLSGSSAAFAAVPTSVTLQVSSASVTNGMPVGLTAKVTSSGSNVFPGQVIFCDATATTCTGSAVLATAQVTSSGTASANLVLGPGQHSVKAVFAGTHTYLAAVSSASSVSVTGLLPTITTLSSQGSTGSYELDATLRYNGVATVTPTDTVDFFDTTHNNLSLGSATISGLTAPAYSFNAVTGSPFPTGKIPSHVAVADVDGDGFPDLIVTNLSDKTVSVLHGDGSGGFTALAGSPYPVSGTPTSVAAGDFNDDGFPDFAVTNATAGTVLVYLNNGNGTFTAAATLTAGNGPQAIVAGDFNFDGNADLAVANVYGSSVTVLLGDGTGHFTAASGSPIATGNNPMALVTADLNGDGFADLAVASASDATVSVLLGQGDGTFQSMASSPFAVGALPEALAVGDFNGDGKPDLAVANAVANSVTVLLNSGSSFSASAAYPAGASPSGVAVGDLNGDGKADLLITNTNDSTATLLSGNGDGTFSVSPGSPLQSFDGPMAATLADVNGDGTLDAVVPDAGFASVSVRALQALQTATAKLTGVTIPGSGTHEIVAKFSGDTNYNSSASAAIALTASLIQTTSTLNISPAATVMYGQTVQLTESFTPSTASNYTATGSGIFTDGGNTLGSAPVSNGQALLSVNTLAVGQHTLASSYSGDSNFEGSTALGAMLSVTKATTTTTLTSSAGTVNSGAGVVLQATVAATTSGTPTGTVSFFDNGGSAAIGQAPLVNGVASFQPSGLSAGSNGFTAVYSGDADYLTSTSQAVPVNNADFAIAATSVQQTVIPGQSTSFTFNVSPTSGSFSAPITFTVSGLPNGTTATFSPASVTPNTATVQTKLTLTTSLQASVAHGHRGIELACVGLLLLLPFGAGRKVRSFLRTSSRRGTLIAGLALLALAAMQSLTGCGAGNGYQQIPSANYTLTITGTSGALSHSTQVTLNLQ